MKKIVEKIFSNKFKLKWLNFIFPPLCIMCILCLIFFAYLYWKHEKNDIILQEITKLRVMFDKAILDENIFLTEKRDFKHLILTYNKIENKCKKCHQFCKIPIKRKKENLIKIKKLLEKKNEITKQINLSLSEINEVIGKISDNNLTEILKRKKLEENHLKKLVLIEAIRQEFQGIFDIFTKGELKEKTLLIEKIENIKQLLIELREISENTEDNVLVEELLNKIHYIKRQINSLENVNKEYLLALENNKKENEKFLITLEGVEKSLSRKKKKLRIFIGAVFIILSTFFIITIGIGSLLLRRLLQDLREIYSNTKKLNQDVSGTIEYEPFFFELKELKDTLNKFSSSLYEHIVRLQFLLTETKNLSSELNKFALAVSQSPVGIILADKDGQIQYINKAYEDITGYSLQEMLGKKDEIFYNIQNIKKMYEEEFLLTKKDGSKVWVKTLVTPIKSENGEIKNWLAIVKDITTEKLLEEKKDLLSRIEILALTAGGLAHDFNNLLAAQLGYLEMALIKKENWEKYIKKARELCLKGRDFTSKLLAITKGTPQKREKISIPVVVKEAIEICLKGTSCEVIMNFSPDLACIIGDRHQILQVFQNLFLNASEAMQGKGKIKIEAETVKIDKKNDLAPGEYVYIKVEDEGPGIPPELREKIFHPFFSTKERGTGLGLATVYSVIKNHGGLIKVKEGNKGGALFEIYLPAKKKKDKKNKTNKKNRKKISCAEFSGKVLILEDDDPLRESLKEMLEVLGFDVEDAKSGENALQILEKNKQNREEFDLIIADLHLNGKMTGEEFLTKIREINEKIQIIVMSGKPLEISIQEKLGVAAFLKKPFSFKDLHHALTQLLKQNFY